MPEVLLAVKQRLLMLLLTIAVLLISFYASTVFQAATMDLDAQPVPLLGD